jgi:site-specific recombinase XerD
MQKTQPVSSTSSSLTLADLEELFRAWIDDGEIRQLSPRTLEERRGVSRRLLWFLRDREYRQCGTRELRSFLAYLNRAHEEDRGRWGNKDHASRTRPVSARTVHAYFRVLRAFFRWLVEAGDLDGSPMETLKPPVVRADQIQPFSQEQAEALLAAARQSTNPRRNETLIHFMLDTGLRASEVCALKVSDLDHTGRKARVRGKGGKDRSVMFGRQTARLLWAYLRELELEGDSPVFLADRGEAQNEPLTRNGLLQLFHRLGKSAGIEAVRCSPHTARHYFAIQFLRAGGNVFSLKELLGHTTLAMTNKYVALAQADLEQQHRQFSPGDRLKRR